MKQASALIWARHKPLVWLVIGLAAIFLIMGVKSNFDNYQWVESHALTEQSFAKHHKDWGYKADQFTKYRHDTYDMVVKNDGDHAPIVDTQVGSKVAVMGILVLTALGLFVAGWDGQSQFDRFLAGLGLKRQTVFWAKLRLYLPLVAGVTLVEEIVPLLAAKVYIPGQYYNLSLAAGSLTVAYNLALVLGGFMVGYFISTVFTRPVVMGLGTVALIVLLNNAVLNLNMMLFPVTSDTYYGGGFDQPGRLFWGILGFAILVFLVTIPLTRWSVMHVSLERTSEQLLVPQLRWLIVSVAAIVSALALINQRSADSFNFGLSITAVVIIVAGGLVWQYWPQLHRRYRRLRHFA